MSPAAQALAAVDESASRTQVARIGAVGLQTVRDGLLAFNAAGPDGLIERKKPDPRPKLDEAQRQALAAIIEEGPDLQRHGVLRGRLKDLAAWLFDRFGIGLDESSVGREVKRMSCAKLSVRPRHHQQDPRGPGGVQKNLPARLRVIRARLPAGMPLEPWWQNILRGPQDEGPGRPWRRP